MRFRTTIELGGKTATGICVPDEVVEALGSHRRPAVRVTIREYSYRSTVATMGGRFMIGVSADVRRAAGVEAGDEVDVDMISTRNRERFPCRPTWPRPSTRLPRSAGRSRR